MKTEKIKYTIDEDLKSLWNSHLTTGQIAKLEDSFSQLIYPEPEESLKYKLKAIAKEQTKVSIWSQNIFRLAAAGGIGVLAFLIFSIAPQSVVVEQSQVALLTEEVSEDELVFLIDYEGQSIAEDVFDNNLKSMENILWQL